MNTTQTQKGDDLTIEELKAKIEKINKKRIFLIRLYDTNNLAANYSRIEANRDIDALQEEENHLIVKLWKMGGEED